jgi:large subunit ribosomal protein L31e
MNHISTSHTKSHHTDTPSLQVYGRQFKKRAPRAIKEIRKFALQQMVTLPSPQKFIVLVNSTGMRVHGQLTDTSQGTSDVRLDPQLNKRVWESGIKGVPFRLRVRISRKRNDEEGAKEKLYSYVQAVNVKDREAKGLQTVVVEDS